MFITVGCIGTRASQDSTCSPSEFDQLADAEEKWQSSKIEAYEIQFQYACNGTIPIPPPDASFGCGNRRRRGVTPNRMAGSRTLWPYAVRSFLLRVLMKTFPAEFLNIDLDIKSNFDPAAIVKAWKNRVFPMHIDKQGRQYWLRLSLALQPKSPTDAITRFAKLVRDLPSRERRLWAEASLKEFDIGIQAGFERGSGEWVLEPKVIRMIADLGARIRVTVYSPLLIIHENAARTRARSRATRKR